MNAQMEKTIPHVVPCTLLVSGDRVNLTRKSDGDITVFPSTSLYFLQGMIAGKSIETIISETYTAGASVDFIALKETLASLYWSKNLVNGRQFDHAFEAGDWLPVKTGRLLSPFYELELSHRSLFFQMIIFSLFLFMAYSSGRFMMHDQTSFAILLLPQTFLTLKFILSGLTATFFNNLPLEMSVHISPLGIYLAESTLRKKPIGAFQYLIQFLITLGLGLSVSAFSAINHNQEYRQGFNVLTILMISLLISPSHKSDLSSFFLILKKSKRVTSSSFIVSALISIGISTTFFVMTCIYLFKTLSYWKTLFIPMSTLVLCTIEFGPDFLDDLDFLAQQFNSTLMQPLKSAGLKALNFWRRPDKLQIISNIPILKSLDPEVLESMATNARILYFQSGIRIFGEGQKGTELYFVLKGSLGIYKKNADGQKAQIISLQKGSVFGEGGFFLGQTRTAEVITKESVSLLCIKRPPELANFSTGIPVASAPDFQRKIWAFQTLMSAPLFNGVPSEFLLQILSQGITRDLEPKAVLMKQGEISDSFWFIIEGFVEVYISGKLHRRLGPGSVLGEIGVIWNVRRTSTVQACSKAIALQISADDLRGLMSQNLNLSVMLQELGLKRFSSDAA